MSAAARPSEAGEAGQVAGIEVLPFAVLVFVIGGLLLVNAWAVVDAKMAASAAAREAARTYAEIPAGMDAAAAGAAAQRAAEDAFAAHGLAPSRTEVRATASPGARRHRGDGHRAGHLGAVGGRVR